MNDVSDEQQYAVDFDDSEEILCPNCDGELIFSLGGFAHCADCGAKYFVQDTLGITKLVRRYAPPSSWKKWLYTDLERSER